MCASLRLNDNKERAEISGNTLLVYLYLLRKRQSCGVREVQRALGFSSSSSAHYHLDKLAYKGILTKDSYGNYRINEKVKIGLTNPFVIIRGFVLPKQIIYATTTSIMCVFFVVAFWNYLTLTVVLALVPGILASGIFWYNAARLWLSLPSFKKGCSKDLENCSNV